MDTHSPFSPFTFPHTARTLDETAGLSLLNITLPHSNGTTLTDEIQCYSIPYGLVGFIFHLASYYTLIITALGRKPLRPWRPLKAKNHIYHLCLSRPLAVHTDRSLETPLERRESRLADDSRLEGFETGLN
jgi:hypothetical protein